MLRLASVAKTTGQSVYPEGDGYTVSSDVFNVVEHSLRILSWQENMPGDEMPPAWMWHLDWEIEEWFKKIKIEREKKFGISSSDTDAEAEGGLFEENVLFDRLEKGEDLWA